MTDNARIVREALERLTSCDWVITLPDRMDAVRAIARDAKPALTALESELAAAQAGLARAREAIVWALGAGDDFPPKVEGRPYWWRTELQKRAGLEWNGKKFVPIRAALAPEQKGE